MFSNINKFDKFSSVYTDWGKVMNTDYQMRLHQAMVDFHKSIFDEKSKKIKSQFAEYTDCPVCHSKQSTLAISKDYFEYRRCSDCTLLYMNPRLNSEATMSFYNSDINKIYNEKKFDQKGITTDTDDTRNFENLEILKDFLANNKISGKVLLEVGCAKGIFLKAAKDDGFEVHGLELNRENCDYANQLLDGAVSPIDLFEMKYSDHFFDIIYMRDVIEHIHNPDFFVKELSRILKPGGVMYMETHNVDSLIHRVVKGKHTTIFGFEHPVHWSPKTIGLLFQKNGIKVRLIKFRSIDFMIGTIVRYFLRPTFTTVFPWQIDGIKKFVLRSINFIVSKPVFRQLDAFVTPKIADFLKAGSTMKVLGVKTK